MQDIHEATDDMLQTAREFGWGNARLGDVIAAAYRLAAAKLRQDGHDLVARHLDFQAVQAEKIP